MRPMRCQQQQRTSGWHVQRQAFGSPVLCGKHRPRVLDCQGMRSPGRGVRWCVGGQPPGKLQLPAADRQCCIQRFAAAAGVLGNQLRRAMFIERQLCDVQVVLG